MAKGFVVIVNNEKGEERRSPAESNCTHLAVKHCRDGQVTGRSRRLDSIYEVNAFDIVLASQLITTETTN